MIAARWPRALVGLALAAALGCATHTRPAAPVAAPAPAGVVRDLRTVADLGAAFDRDRDHPRIVLLLSPT
jgi:hypothetical protein